MDDGSARVIGAALCVVFTCRSMGHNLWGTVFHRMVGVQIVEIVNDRKPGRQREEGSRR